MLPPPADIFSACASAVAYIVTLKTIFHASVPVPVQKFVVDFLRSRFGARLGSGSSTATLIIEDRNMSGTRNSFYDDVQEYIGSTRVSDVAKKMKATRESDEKHLRFSIAEDEVISDLYRGKKLEFKYNKVEKSDPSKVLGQEFIEIKFEEIDRDFVLKQYLPYIIIKAAELRSRNKVSIMYTHSNANRWEKMKLIHPSTFENIAMEPSLKLTLLSDIDRFIGRKEFYKRVGKAWKRAYLLYGPPGTGKSSLAAAIANYLNFDIFELQLSSIQDDSSLRKLLLGVRNGSILLLEDIDRLSLDLSPQLSSTDLSTRPKATGLSISLAGLLNSIDGVWSSCGEERIIIFTTNNKQNIDPVLLRPGRMDFPIHMGYCSFEGFKTLATNYLDGLTEHTLFPKIEILIDEAEITPAEVAEELMRADDSERALEALVKLLERKKGI